MKKLFLLFAFLLSFTFINCSNDDDKEEIKEKINFAKDIKTRWQWSGSAFYTKDYKFISKEDYTLTNNCGAEYWDFGDENMKQTKTKYDVEENICDEFSIEQPYALEGNKLTLALINEDAISLIPFEIIEMTKTTMKAKRLQEFDWKNNNLPRETTYIEYQLTKVPVDK